MATVTQEKDGLVATVTSLKEELSNTSEQLATVTQGKDGLDLSPV
jgi:hypothetical protein